MSNKENNQLCWLVIGKIKRNLWSTISNQIYQHLTFKNHHSNFCEEFAWLATDPTPTYNKSHEANVVQTVIIWLPATSKDLPRTGRGVGPSLCRIKSELLELLHSAAVYQVSMKILGQIMGWCQNWSWSELIWLINWNQASRCQERLES